MMGYRLSQIVSTWSEEVLTHSTVIGRVWLTVLFFLRVFVLVVASPVSQHDLVREMTCDTEMPGCTEACYNHFFPVLPTRFWCVQIIFASTPSLLYLAYAMHVIYTEHASGKGSVNVRKSVMIGCFAQLLVKIMIEAAFIVAQYFLYGFMIQVNVKCGMIPCAHSVNCYLAQSSELTLVSRYMLAVACLSVALNGLEGILLSRKLRGRSGKCVQVSNLRDLSDKYEPGDAAEASDLAQVSD